MKNWGKLGIGHSYIPRILGRVGLPSPIPIPICQNLGIAFQSRSRPYPTRFLSRYHPPQDISPIVGSDIDGPKRWVNSVKSPQLVTVHGRKRTSKQQYNKDQGEISASTCGTFGKQDSSSFCLRTSKGFCSFSECADNKQIWEWQVLRARFFGLIFDFSPAVSCGNCTRDSSVRSANVTSELCRLPRTLKLIRNQCNQIFFAIKSTKNLFCNFSI